MSGGQIAALVFAILLLLPGGCFLLFGIDFYLHGLGLSEHPNANTGDPSLLLIGLGILAVVALLFWLAFRRRASATAGGPPQAPRDPKP